MEDIIGNKYGMVEITAFVKREKHPKHNCYKHTYLGRCECGTEREFLRNNLLTGHTKSCGCLKRRCGSASPTFTGTGEIGGYHWAQIKHHAKGRDLPFEVTIEQAWDKFQEQGGKCALTGLSLNFIIDGKKNSRTASLDRIDNTKGYVEGNIQWLHKDINWMKGTFSTDRFKELCRLVAQGGEREI